MRTFFLLSLCFFVISIIFPIYLTANFNLSPHDGRLNYSIYLYRLLRLQSGYVQITGGGLMLHLTEKKAVFIPLKSIIDTGSKFETFWGFKVVRFNLLSELSLEKMEYSLMASQFASIMSDIVLRITAKNTALKDFHANFVLNEKENANFTSSITIRFNLFVLFMAILKILIERFIEYVKENRNRKQAKY